MKPASPWYFGILWLLGHLTAVSSAILLLGSGTGQAWGLLGISRSVTVSRWLKIHHSPAKTAESWRTGSDYALQPPPSPPSFSTHPSPPPEIFTEMQAAVKPWFPEGFKPQAGPCTTRQGHWVAGQHATQPLGWLRRRPDRERLVSKAAPDSL